MINILRGKQTVKEEAQLINQTIIELFERQVFYHPDKVAVRWMGKELTYAELNGRANYLGAKLRRSGVEPDDVIAILTRQDMDMVVAMMGILKAGAAYLPIALDTPVQRIRYMLKDSQARFLLTNTTEEGFKDLEIPFMAIEQDKTLDKNLPIVTTVNDLLYVIYTSGTTGNPKGVMIENRNLANTINWRIQTGEMSHQSIFLQRSPYVFDVSVGEIFSALLSGGMLQLVAESQMNDFEALAEVIEENQVTHMSVVSTFFFEWLDYLRENSEAGKLDSLVRIYLGGDSVTLSLLERYRQVITHDKHFSKLINEYGPTECAMTATSLYLKEFEGEVVTIGKPIANTEIYLINREGELCENGEIGELCIGGRGVSRGYLNQAELTKDVFVMNPYSEGELLYRSGDLAKYGADDELHFLGRIDDQVKIRGYRIELDEIKDALCELPEIEGAAVSIWEKEGTQHLCGYVVFGKGVSLTQTQISKQLGKRLGAYMIPTFIVPIEKIPLTVNGKLDRRGLPEPEMSEAKERVAASTEEQKITVQVFKEVLGLEEVSINDSFFELGGDSIKAIRMISRFRFYHYSIDLPTIMESRYVNVISEKIQKTLVSTESYEVITGKVLLTPIQKLFFESDLAEPQHFNQSFLLKSEPLEKELLNQAFASLLAHHDMLRAVYQGANQEILPVNQAKAVKVDYFSLDHEDEPTLMAEIEAISNRYQENLDLAGGPLVAALCFSTPTCDYLLLMIHHLVVDGISWRIIVEDLNSSYLAAREGQVIKLPPKTDAFQKWSELLTKHSQRYHVQQELPYWETVISPIEQSRISDVQQEQSELKVQQLIFDEKLTSQLLYEAGKAYHLEINDLLLTALFRTVKTLANSTTVSVQLEGHGREILDQGESIDRTVGWFTVMYPVTVHGIGDSVAGDLKQTKETLRRIPKHGIGYGVLCDQNPQLEQNQAEITFNYLGVFNEEASSALIKIDTVEFGNQVSSKNRFGTKINMDSSVSNGELLLNISYDTAFFSPALITRLKETYEAELKAVVSHCLTVTETEYGASDFGELEWSAAEFSQVNQEITRKKDQIQRIFPLTPMQEGMLYHKLMDQTSTSYVVQNSFQLKGQVNWQQLTDSFDLLAKKHGILRGMIKYTGVKEPRLVMLKNRKIDYQFVDLSEQSDCDQQIKARKAQDLQRGFDLENEALFRIQLIKTEAERYQMIMSFHHIILDGWCLGPLLADLIFYYSQLAQGAVKGELLATLMEDMSYDEYLKEMSLKDKGAALDYWQALLSDYTETAQIIAEGRPAKVAEEVTLIDHELTVSQYDELKQFSQGNGQTVNTVIEAAWGTVLGAYNNTSDVVFGKVVSGRNVEVEGIEQALGLFINTIPVRMVIEQEQRFVDVVKQLQQQSFESETYDFCSLVEIQKDHVLGQELFQSIIVFENEYQSDHSGQLMLEPEAIREQTNYPITISVVQGETLKLRISYDTEIYNRSEMLHVLAHFKQVLLQVGSSDITMNEIELMDDAEEERVLRGFNRTESDKVEGTFIQAFNRQVNATPTNVAVKIGTEELTYQELNEKANALGQTLRDQGIGRESIVGILSDRSLEMIIGIYGILKSGAAYLPIDPSSPLERISYTLKNSQAALLLVDGENEGLAQQINVTSLVLRELASASDNLTEINQPEDLAYVIYTSGTTGLPKGVMVEHRQLMNTVAWHIRDAEIGADSVVLQKSSFAFDVSVAEIFTWSLTGGCLQLLSPVENDDFHLLADVIEQNNVTHFFMVSTLFAVFLDYLIEVDRQGVFDDLKHVYLGGDKMTLDIMDKLQDHYGDYSFTISNAYGPTECTIAASSYKITDFKEVESLPIGKPIDNASLYVMNQGKLCGIGVPGELFIGGAGVSRGYLNNEALTQEMFSDNPYVPGEKIYRTGDLVRWLDDGNLDILGRMDEQVKIRGFRIELGEIKSKLVELGEITDAAVVIQEVNGSYLLNAFVVSDKLDVPEVKAALKKELPSYMIPDFIQQIPTIPTTRNGKLDKSKLPLPEIETARAFVLPQTAIEQRLYTLYQDILAVSAISIYDRFFDLGGHSLKAIRLSGAIEKELQAQLSIGDILEAQTIEQLAQLVELKQADYGGYQPLVTTNNQEMSSVQRRLYALNQLEPESVLYNVPVLMQADGQIDVPRLEGAVTQLVSRHEPLRTVFGMEGDCFIQEILETVPVRVVSEAITFTEVKAKTKGFIQPFDLAKGPLFRVKVFQLPDDTSILALDFHHLIFDGGSLPSVLNDLSHYYGKGELPPLIHQYRDYSAYANQQDLSTQADFWLQEFADGIERMALPTDFPRPAIQGFEGKVVHGKLDGELKARVQRLSKQTNKTEYAILLGAFNLLLSRYCQTDTVVVGVPVSGRAHPDVQEMLGMFVNTLVFKNQVNQDASFETLVSTIQDRSLRAFEHQEYPYEELVAQLEPTRDRSRNPLFDIMFAFEKQLDQELTLDGLNLKELSVDGGIAKFDLTLNIHEQTDSYEMFWEYNTDLFKADTIQQMMASFISLLDRAMEESQTKVGRIPSLDAAQQAAVYGVLNETDSLLPMGNIMDLFSQIRDTHLEQHAISFEDKPLTYGQLNDYANQMAHALIERGIGHHDRIGIEGHKTIETIVGILAILKVGGTYVPLDPKNPISRQTYMIEDSQIKLVLTSEDQTALSALVDTMRLDLTDLTGSSQEVASLAQPDDTAYIIYTSGTTGLPKGVMVSHRNIIRLVKNTNFIEIQGIRILQTGSLAFDASTFEIWGALLNGGSLTMTDQEVLFDPQALHQAIKVNQIDVIFMTTALFNQLVSEDVRVFDYLTTIIVGGEKLSEYHIQLLRHHNQTIVIKNAYGPTETTTFALTYTLGSEIPVPVPIGTPIANTSAYVVYQDNLCGVGMPGELYIGGAGVSKGYLNQAETAFISHPPFAPNEARLYKTGDLVKLNTDGQIDYLGRLDEQVKIRGYRIELNEITKQLLALSAILEAVTIVTEESGSKEIASYLVANREMTTGEVLASLEAHLPDYMVPKQLMFLSEIPKTKNGKIDTKALPKIELVASKGYVAPRNDQEAELLAIFKAILGVDLMGVDDSFFELGGDSIKAIRIVSRLREHHYQATTKLIMERKTVRKISEVIERGTQVKEVAQQVAGEAKLTPIQAAFFRESLPVPHHFNQSLLLETTGQFNEQALKASLDYLVEYHDNLRASFKAQTFVIPENHEQAYAYRTFTLSGEDQLTELETIGNDLQKEVDLNGPLFTAAHFKGREDYLLLIAHHLVIDGVSWRIIYDDFTRCYTQALNGEKLRLPAKTDSFLKWSEALEQYGTTITTKEMTYWETVEEKLAGSRLKEVVPDARPLTTIQFELSSVLTDQLVKGAGLAYNTKANDLLLAAFVKAIQGHFSTNRVGINMEGHGREQVTQELMIDRTVGWFTSIYPVVFDIGELRETIIHVKETLRRVPNNGIGYGVVKARHEFKQLPEFTFNYLGEIGEAETDSVMAISNKVSFEEIDRHNKFGSPITLNALVRNGVLEVALNVDPAYMDQGQQGFAETFKQTLEEVIAHCMAIDEPQPTLSDFGELVWDNDEFMRMLAEQEREIEQIERIYPMTPMQQGMLYHKAVDQASTSYVIQSEFKVTGAAIDETRLKQTFQLLAKKYSILRTNVVYRHVEEPRLLLHKEKTVAVEIIDYRQKDGLAYEEQVTADLNRGFDLERDSLLRATLIRLPKEQRLILTFHHIILDGWCTSILINEIKHFYTRLANGESFKDIQDTLVIDDSFETHVRQLAAQDPAEGLAYWQDLVSGYESRAEIAPDNETEREPLVLTSDSHVSKELSETIKLTAQTLGVTLNTFIETAWGIVLQKYNRTNDVVFGKVISGRDAEVAGIEQSLGLYINTILLRVDSTDQTVEQLVQAMQEQSLKSGRYDQSSLAAIQAQGSNSQELIQTLFVFENYHTEELAESHQAIQLEMVNAREETNYGITLSGQYTDHLSFKLMYDSASYRGSSIERVLKRLEAVLAAMAKPSQLVAEIPLFDHQDSLLVASINKPIVAGASDQSIHQLFEKWVAERPNQVAVSYQEQRLTYQELNQQADLLAFKLRQAGVQAEEPVGLVVSKSLEVIIGIMGILKANAVYVPLDPKNPRERNDFILSDSQCQWVLTTTGTCSFIGERQQMAIQIEANVAIPSPFPLTKPGLAYLMYTSGTSGKPKGVMVDHHNVIDLAQSDYGDLREARILQGGSLAFDASTFEIFGALLNGGSLYLADEEQLSNPELLKETLEVNQITCMFMTTGLFNQLVSVDPHVFDSLATLLVGGEQGSEKHFRLLREQNATIKLSNIYGPTENTTFALVYPIGETVPSPLPIGKPIANASAYILNDGVSCGVDIPGELYLGGEGVARGYYHQPELTAEKFVTNHSERLYRTGDLVKMNEAGELLFLGRVDQQVKIRGFRIELDEIANQLRSMPEILDAVVVVKELNEDKVIGGYLTTAAELDISEIHGFLEQRLPDYMIPGYLEILEELPLTKNGKVDRNALPDIEHYSSAQYVAPSTENETILVEIFQKVLEVERIGIDDNFFELGGHSLKVMNVVNLLEKEKQLTLSFRSVIEGKTVRKIAQTIESEAKAYVPMEMTDEEVF